MAPRFVPQYSALEMFICRDTDMFLHLRLILWMFRLVWYLSSSTRDRLKKGTPLLRHLNSSLFPSTIY